MKSFIVLSIILPMHLLAQNWAGTYQGSFNNDQVTLTLSPPVGNVLKGIMQDSKQTYDLVAEVGGNRFAGDAKDRTLGITFTILAEKIGESLNCNMIISFLGQQTENKFTLTKVGSTVSTAAAGTKPLNNGLPRDQALIGKWTKNESYNSGSGSNFMGSNFSQSLHFLEDGSLADGGSSASMSGSNYSGSSSSSGLNKVPGVSWHTKDNHIWLTFTENGVSQTQDLGKYYIEGRNMLITGNNGVKLLLSR
jgi:hypothetical protein